MRMKILLLHPLRPTSWTSRPAGSRRGADGAHPRRLDGPVGLARELLFGPVRGAQDLCLRQGDDGARPRQLPVAKRGRGQGLDRAREGNLAARDRENRVEHVSVRGGGAAWREAGERRRGAKGLRSRGGREEKG